jgi:hypothetical protein
MLGQPAQFGSTLCNLRQVKKGPWSEWEEAVLQQALASCEGTRKVSTAPSDYNLLTIILYKVHIPGTSNIGSLGQFVRLSTGYLTITDIYNYKNNSGEVQ